MKISQKCFANVAKDDLIFCFCQAKIGSPSSVFVDFNHEVNSAGHEAPACCSLTIQFCFTRVARKVNYEAYLQSNYYLFNQFALQSKTEIIK